LLQKNPFNKLALVDALNFRDSLDAADQLFQVRKVNKPVDSADVVQAKVDHLYAMKLCFDEAH